MHGVVDLREAELDITVEEVEGLGEIGAKNSKARWAVMVDDPKNTAFSLLYSDVVNKSHPMAIMSYDKAASEYLDIFVTPYLNTLRELL